MRPLGVELQKLALLMNFERVRVDSGDAVLPMHEATSAMHEALTGGDEDAGDGDEDVPEPADAGAGQGA